MEEHDIAEADIRSAKKEADYEQSLARKSLLEGRVPEAEQHMANIAKTGMAFSGPAEERVAIEQKGKEGALRDVTLAKRDIQDTFEGDLSDLETARTETQGDLETAQLALGESLQGMLDDSSSKLSELHDWMSQSVDAHKAWGERIAGAPKWTPSTSHYKKRYRFGSKEGLVGTKGAGHTGYGPAPTAYEAPGGYFAEHTSEAFPGYRAAEAELNAAQAFRNWLSTKGKQELASFAPTPDYDLGTEG
jgi:hypothetical protein